MGGERRLERRSSGNAWFLKIEEPPPSNRGRRQLQIQTIKIGSKVAVRLTAKIELLKEGLVAVIGSALEVIKQLAATRNHHQKTAA